MQKCKRLMGLHDNLAELKSEYDAKKTLSGELLGFCVSMSSHESYG